MPTWTAIVSFAAVAFAMALSPGPNLLYLASRAVCQGRAAGLVSLAGVCSAMALYLLAAAAGLSALFVAAPVAYEALRWCGVGYLLWLVWGLLRSDGAALAPSQPAAEPLRALYRRGFLTCLLNPKVVVTYGALLPQFVEPASGHVLEQTLVLGLVQIAAAAAAHTLVIAAAAAVAAALSRHPACARLQRKVLGVGLAALALRLAAERRPVG